MLPDENEDTISARREMQEAFEERTPFVALTGRPERNTVINDDDILNLRIALALNTL
jgi:hypothetical protein